jgi:hypothetical protein
MTDLRTLHDAFGELERRADAATAASALSTSPRPRRTLGPRLVPVAATVVAVAGLAAGVVWLVPGNTGTQAGSPPTITSSPSAPPTTEPPVPTTAADLIDRFKRVLGDTATFTVNDTAGAGHEELPPPTSTPAGTGGGPDIPVSATSVPNDGASGNGVHIVGTLTAGGVTGGFDLQIYAAQPGSGTWCDDPDRSTCTQTTLPDGSNLAIGSEPLQDAGGVTYMAFLVRPDGTSILMHLSNQRDPKGAGEIFGPQPPLTTDQLTAIVSSDRW